MSDISKKLIEQLKSDFAIKPLKIVTSQTSKDGTMKFLFEMEDGALVESVLMVFDYGFSACLSSQVGCNMGCSFCASGLLKKQRDLTGGNCRPGPDDSKAAGFKKRKIRQYRHHGNR